MEKPIDFDRLGKFPTPETAIDAIHKAGGLAILAHPFAPPKLTAAQAQTLALDAIETANARAMLKKGANDKARALAAQLGLPETGGSDAHCAGELGGCVTEFFCEPSVSALRQALAAGQTRPAELHACKWVWKGLSKIRREKTCGTFFSRCKALCYFAGCVLRDVFHI